MPFNSVYYYNFRIISYIRPAHNFQCSHVALSIKSLGTPWLVDRNLPDISFDEPSNNIEVYL